jgi:hypothetical protein
VTSVRSTDFDLPTFIQPTTKVGRFRNIGLQTRVPLARTKFQRKGENVMKTFVSIVALALALAFTGPAFAGDVTAAKTETDCQKAGGMWDAKTNTCAEKKM